MSARGLVMALTALATLSLGACSSTEDTCAELRSDLKKCGLSATSLDCDRVDQSALESMVSRFAEDGCGGAGESGQSDAVDPRLCKAAGWTCPESPTPRPGTARPIHPLVLVSGI